MDAEILSASLVFLFVSPFCTAIRPGSSSVRAAARPIWFPPEHQSPICSPAPIRLRTASVWIGPAVWTATDADQWTAGTIWSGQDQLSATSPAFDGFASVMRGLTRSLFAFFLSAAIRPAHAAPRHASARAGVGGRRLLRRWWSPDRRGVHGLWSLFGNLLLPHWTHLVRKHEHETQSPKAFSRLQQCAQTNRDTREYQQQLQQSLGCAFPIAMQIVLVFVFIRFGHSFVLFLAPARLCVQLLRDEGEPLRQVRSHVRLKRARALPTLALAPARLSPAMCSMADARTAWHLPGLRNAAHNTTVHHHQHSLASFSLHACPNPPGPHRFHFVFSNPTTRGLRIEQDCRANCMKGRAGSAAMTTRAIAIGKC